MTQLLAFPRPGCRLVHLTPELFSMVMQDKSVLPFALVPGRSFAVLEGGTLACALGIFPVHFGRWHGWLIKTPMATRRHMAYASRQARLHFDRWQREDPSCRRIEIQIRADQPWRESFAKALGMTEALGPMRAWDIEGRDYWLYARIAP